MKFVLTIFTFIISVAACSQTAKNCKTLIRVDNVESAYPRLSEDGKKILYQSNHSGKWQLRIFDIDSKADSAITHDNSNNNFPDWSRDKKWIAYVSDRSGNEDVYLMNAATGETKNITNHPGRDIHPYFSPDGRYILFNSTRGNESFDIYRYEIAENKVLRFTDTPDDETCARYSPDMKLMVYLKNGPTEDDVYVMNTTDFLSENITKTPYARDGWPMFNLNGDWIYFSSLEEERYSIYRIKPDGSQRMQITWAEPGEEHARVYISADHKYFVYNRRIGKTIEVVQCEIATK